MALNPILFTERVVSDFLRYQLTTYAFADLRLREQMRRLLSLTETRRSPLLKGPYLSLSRAFRAGATLAELAADGVLHPFLANLAAYPRLYAHQDRALRAIHAGRNVLVSTGTGSGKTEAFLYPVISHCLALRDAGAPAGIAAVLVYPMNALAEDQLGRLRDLLAGTGIPFGMYVGRTPEKRSDVPGERVPAGGSRAEYRARLARAQAEKRGTAVHPAEERASREEMRAEGGQPRILLTNVKQLELLLTRQSDVELFSGSALRYLVFDEAHTFAGSMGAETACLVRRLRAFAGASAEGVACIGTSATLLDPAGGPGPARAFAHRFFGVPEDSVEVIGEEHQMEEWPADGAWPPAPPRPPEALLADALNALDAVETDPAPLAALTLEVSGAVLDPGRWSESLYDTLLKNALCRTVAEQLVAPRSLDALCRELAKPAGRPVGESELLLWLALGAAARRDGRPLLRPVLHGFVRGVGGAVVTFPDEENEPRLWLSAEDAVIGGGSSPRVRLTVSSCTTCGQHYFIHFVKDLEVTEHGLAGGVALENRHFWPPLEQAQGATRVVLLDRTVAPVDPDDPEADPDRTEPVFLCRQCGALHPASRDRCDACGAEAKMVRLLAVENRRRPGYLGTCLSCGASGRERGNRYREPARPVRAVAVSDVHVLAQNMIQYADRRRLLVFADNRQEAAFQAGWMRDHARRFRLRALMWEELGHGAASIGDLTVALDRRMDADDDLSRALLPEVWAVTRKEAAGGEHANERRKFLRIQVLREITTGHKQRVGLEPWGRLRVEYLGLTHEHPFVQHWATTLGIPAERLVEGFAHLMDYHRRSVQLLDREGRLFTRFPHESSPEIQRGYLPLLRNIPKGVKLQRAPDDDGNRVSQWLSEKGDTLPRQLARKWGVPADAIPQFLTDLWAVMSEELGLLAPATLLGQRGNPLPRCSGTRQVDGDRLRLLPQRERWRCTTCQRAQPRPAPRDLCPAWRCDGALVHEVGDPDDYDLLALDRNFALLRPAEHSAQVPADERDRLERAFKADDAHERVNTLVCTPTLEMGVDIGGLDTVLLRNVPPLPANYWQRVGRAGRRHRLAVNLTYARDASHDRAYFSNPEKLLAGRVEAPRFNLRNELMVARHGHAAAITRLHQLSRPEGGLSESDRTEVAAALTDAFPRHVKTFLFDDRGHVRQTPYDLGPLAALVARHEADLTEYLVGAFTTAWPVAEAGVVSEIRLREFVRGFVTELERVVRTLRRRLDWCLDQIRRLNDEQARRGSLEPDEEGLRDRCEALVKRLKGTGRRQRRETEGYDDATTYGVLAAEGFLPGYGLETGSIVGTAYFPNQSQEGKDFDLPRPPASAVREFVPGNLIYANGHRFIVRQYHLTETDEALRPRLFEFDQASGAVTERGVATPEAIATLGARALTAVPISDVELPHYAQISDDEDFRFQLPVTVVGYETGRHGPGLRLEWGPREIAFRQGVHFRLVNVGATALVADGNLGYPISLVSGQSRSPFASDRELADFRQKQLERYGRPVQPVGLFCDVIADALTLPDCAGADEACSVLETLRLAMSLVLEMEREDLQILVIPRAGATTVSGVLFDPMPGGSGLLDQARERWGEIVARARELAGHCEGACERSCVDCLQSFRNAWYHKHLDRRLAGDLLYTWGDQLQPVGEIPPALQERAPVAQGLTVNSAEATLKGMLERAHFPAAIWQHRINLGAPFGATVPDAFFPGQDGDPGVCVYLDGLSDGIHGKPETAAKDAQLREALRNRSYEVVTIAASELSDREAMTRHFARLARYIMGNERAREVRDANGWFGTTQ